MVQPCQQCVRPSALPYPGTYGCMGLFPEDASPVPGSTGLSFTQALHDEVLTLGRAPPSEGASSGAQTGLFGHIVVTLALHSCSQCSGWFFNESKEIPLKISVGGFFEEKAILITILCKRFLSVFVILEDVQTVTDGLYWADFSSAML